MVFVVECTIIIVRHGKRSMKMIDCLFGTLHVPVEHSMSRPKNVLYAQVMYQLPDQAWWRETIGVSRGRTIEEFKRLEQTQFAI